MSVWINRVLRNLKFATKKQNKAEGGAQGRIHKRYKLPMPKGNQESGQTKQDIRKRATTQ